MRLSILLLAFAFFFAYGCGSEDDETSSVDPSSDQSPDETSSEVADSAPDEVSEPEQGPVIWAGPRIIFEKENFADFMDVANQDVLTERVILTRGDEKALFNITLEDISDNDSPAGTEWAQGTTAELEELDFQPFKTAAKNQLRRIPGKSFVLHLPEEDICLDVTFLTWTSGNSSGGGFSYERSTPSD